MRFKHLILTILLLASGSIYAQPPLDWTYVATVGGGFQDYVEDVFVDAAGNTYACGNFRGSLTIGSDNLFASGAGQVFVTKLDPTGNPIWAIQSSGNSQAFANSIYVDNAGCTYVTGFHSHSVLSFSGLSVPSSSNEGFYILKINPTGLPLHLTGPTFASTGKSRGDGIVSDGDFVYVIGSHKADLTLPGGPTLPITQGGSDVFITKIDSAFAGFTFAASHGGASDDLASEITMSGTRLFATGNYGAATCTFNTSGTDYDLPNYGADAFWITDFNKSNGAVNWSTSGGSANPGVAVHDIAYNAGQVIVSGGCPDVTTLIETPLTAGPFTYNDTIYSNGGLDAFVARYNSVGVIQAKWNEGGIGEDIAYGLTVDLNCSEVQICGSFEDSVNFGGTTPLIALDKDIFVVASDNNGLISWAFKQISSADAIAYSIHSNSAGNTSVGGEIYDDAFFSTSPLTITSHNGMNDQFIFQFDCATPAPCGPVITACQENDTVLADASCSYVVGDYTGIAVVDGCTSGGVTVTQSPPSSSILGAGIQQITLTAEDMTGNKSVCFFNVVVKATNNVNIVECGDVFTNQNTGGSNNYDSFSCSSTTTPGEDDLYHVTVDNGNQFVQIKMSNVVDSNDDYAYIYWLDATCPTAGTCVSIDSLEISTGLFSNNSPYQTFQAPGPGTYFLVVDCVTDSLQQYDLEFYCSSAGIYIDDSGCDVADTDSDGIISYVNSSNTDLLVQPCETVNICHDIYIANPTDFEWVDSVEMKLGDCYENINLATLSPNTPPNDNGYYNNAGEWTASYNAGSNSIIWEFAHSSGNAWGDGSGGAYNCQLYNFCFDADIASTCTNQEDLNIGIVVGDDGGKGVAPSTNLFDIGNSSDFILQDDNPFFSFSTAVLCDGDPSTLPDSITTSGGSFTASAGIVFTDGSPSPTGEIDLSASTIGGPYTVTYEVGLCPFTHDFIVDVFAQEDPTFNYSSPSYCQGETDPVATVTGTGGGLFSGPTEIIFVDNMTGEIDLDASTAGGPYYVTYTTPGPNCVNADSVQLTINAEDDPSFNYASVDHCAADANVTPTSITTPGGTFSEYTGDLNVNGATGEVDIAGSIVGNYYVVYTSPGPNCPNVDSVQFNILVEDDPAFDYASTAYCQGELNPVANILGTGGGTFSGPAGLTFTSTSTGEIDLTNSTAGGPYTITYTTPGPDCPNNTTFNITINAEDDSSFSYASAIICLADANPVPTITGTTGGTFMADPGITFTDGSPSPTGEIDIIASTVGGPYTITYTTPGPDCPNSMDFVLSIFPEDNPTFFFGALSYCSNETDPVPAVTTPGGTFTGPVTFVDNTTGEVDLDASTPGGPYQITYTTAGPECPNSFVVFINIDPLDDPSFDYGDSLFCTSDLVVDPNITGTSGGVFTSFNSELIVNVNGQIDLDSSTAGGPYTVQYATTGACPDTSEVNVTLFDPVSADAGPDQDLFMNFTTDLEAVPVGSFNGTWSIISGSGTFQDDSNPSTEVTDLAEGTNELEWTVTNGACPPASDQMIITVSNLFIPEAVTPNNDGQNDFFFIDGIDLLTNRIEIFNRWGQKVYETDNYQNDWTGLDQNGNELSNDTYYYIITVDDDTFKGFIVLQR